ncbi:hypothetical protein HPB52_018347 [Rhipicephalus sanguineus]|uniref:Uncharacterized protein n=1 Tax=Rhipicephalus sanguineus TaxID=34632 RepID=A0A9D4Q2L0_RHISA|nr:hypothetical protein HPB52_018347 [Rhipicephalus sanguineus]
MNSPGFWNIFAFIRVLYGSILLGTVREYINQSTKIVRLECHLRFNYECLNNNVVPRSLYCKTLVDTPYGRKLARDFSRNCLKARIQDNKQQIHQALFETEGVSILLDSRAQPFALPILLAFTRLSFLTFHTLRVLVARPRGRRQDEPVGPPGGVAVLDKLVLWRPPPKDYHLEELRSIDRDAETVRSVLAEMQEFMPHESNCKNLIEEGLFKWRRKGGLYGQLGHHLCCLCRSHIS